MLEGFLDPKELAGPGRTGGIFIKTCFAGVFISSEGFNKLSGPYKVKALVNPQTNQVVIFKVADEDTDGKVIQSNGSINSVPLRKYIEAHWGTGRLYGTYDEKNKALLFDLADMKSTGFDK